MPAPRYLPSDTELRRHVSVDRMTYKQIGELYGVSEQAVYRKMNAMNATTPRPDYSEIIPYRIATRHQKAMPMRHLRAFARQRTGLEVNPDELRRMNVWIEMLTENDLVVCYDPEYPPNEASAAGGWHYEKRKPSDGDHLVRPPT